MATKKFNSVEAMLDAMAEEREKRYRGRFGWFWRVIDWLEMRWYNIVKLKDCLCNRFWRKFYLMDTRLPKWYYYDKDVVLLHGVMELVVDYVEKEGGLEMLDWSENERTAKLEEKIEIAYNWWKDYPLREKEIEDMDTETKEELLKNMDAEELLAKEAEAVLKGVIEARRALWT